MCKSSLIHLIVSYRDSFGIEKSTCGIYAKCFSDCIVSNIISRVAKEIIFSSGDMPYTISFSKRPTVEVVHGYIGSYHQLYYKIPIRQCKLISGFAVADIDNREIEIINTESKIKFEHFIGHIAIFGSPIDLLMKDKRFLSLLECNSNIIEYYAHPNSPLAKRFKSVSDVTTIVADLVITEPSSLIMDVKYSEVDYFVVCKEKDKLSVCDYFKLNERVINVSEAIEIIDNYL